MNSNKLPRILVDICFKTNQNFALCSEDSHYLANVLRLKINDQILIFNGIDGEHLAVIKLITKKQVYIQILNTSKEQPIEKYLFSLAFAPIKAARMHFLIEKATELGISCFYPIKTTYSVIDKTSEIKYFKWIKAALEQSRGLIVPKITPLNNLKNFLLEKSKSSNIIFCNENEEDNYILKVLTKIDLISKENIILVGPEGGFSTEEKDFILQLPNVYSVSISNTILRTETASIAAIICCKNFIL